MKGKDKQEEKEVVPLVATLSKITNQFNFTMTFSKDMNFTVIEDYVYGLFKLEVESAGVVFGRSDS